MSGNFGYVTRQEADAVAAAQAAAELSTNRTALLNFVGSWLKAKYGENAFYATHPLVSAINNSAAGSVVDLMQLQTDCASWQLPTEGN